MYQPNNTAIRTTTLPKCLSKTQQQQQQKKYEMFFFVLYKLEVDLSMFIWACEYDSRAPRNVLNCSRLILLLLLLFYITTSFLRLIVVVVVDVVDLSKVK